MAKGRPRQGPDLHHVGQVPPTCFRSNGGERLLPDVVAGLKGLAHLLVGEVDSVKGSIRTTSHQVPGAPVAKFTPNLKGDKKGPLVNNRNLCKNKLKADVKMSGQNGRVLDTRPVVRTSCKKGKTHGKRG